MKKKNTLPKTNAVFGRFFTVIITLIIIFSLSGCTAESGENIAFGTFYNVKISGAGATAVLKDIDRLLQEIEQEVSTAIPESDISKINASSAGQPVRVGQHTAFLFKKSLELYGATDRAFNAALFPLVELWNFSPDTFTGVADSIPSDTSIAETLEYCAMENFSFDIDRSEITKHDDRAKLDFGGIAKGYAVDKILELCQGKKQALINIGGNIATFGGDKTIGITHPRDTSSLFGVIALQDAAIATSGDYQRYYTVGGVRYNHIITDEGYPTGITNNDIISASVIGSSAMVCDALSTAVIVRGAAWAEVLPQMGYSVIIVTKDSYKIIGDIDFESTQTTHRRS